MGEWERERGRDGGRGREGGRERERENACTVTDYISGSEEVEFSLQHGGIMI